LNVAMKEKPVRGDIAERDENQMLLSQIERNMQKSVEESQFQQMTKNIGMKKVENDGTISTVRIPRGSQIDSFRNSPSVFSGHKEYSSLPPVKDIQDGTDRMNSGKKPMKFILPGPPPESLIKQLGKSKKSMSYFKNTNQSQGSIVVLKDDQQPHHFGSEDLDLRHPNEFMTYRNIDSIKGQDMEEYPKVEANNYNQHYFAAKNKMPFIIPKDHRKANHLIESLGTSGVYRSQSLAKDDNIGKLIEMSKRPITKEKKKSSDIRTILEKLKINLDDEETQKPPSRVVKDYRMSVQEVKESIQKKIAKEPTMKKEFKGLMDVVNNINLIQSKQDSVRRIGRNTSEDITPKQRGRDSRQDLRDSPRKETIRIMKKETRLKKEGLLQEGDLSIILANNTLNKEQHVDTEEIVFEKGKQYKDKKLVDLLADLDAMDTQPAEIVREKKTRKKERVFN